MLFLENSIYLIIFDMKIHKLYAYVIYDLCCNIYLSAAKGDSKSARGSKWKLLFNWGGEALTLKHTIPLQMHF